eukprot:TRINITY_DN7244_c3_g1_i1.p1 TRINITY_DN7244_c3_g1~~TRINITY_DN7244_c3_g1_i1.p1  ORF type:complete len:1591 (+),score=386.94 TRINITY_DN7244_c3_g1_i1:108-4880(+)
MGFPSEKGDRKGDRKGGQGGKGDRKGGGEKEEKRSDRNGEGKGEGKKGSDSKGKKGDDGKGKKGDGKGKQDKVISRGLRGKIMNLMKDKPSGFIQRMDGDRDVFFDLINVVDGEKVEPHDPVEFDIVEGSGGRLFGTRIKKLPKDADLTGEGQSLKSNAPAMASKVGSLTGGALTLGGPSKLTGGKLTGGLSLRPGGMLSPGGGAGGSLLSGGPSKPKEETKTVEETSAANEDEQVESNCLWGRIVKVRDTFCFLERIGSGGDGGADIFFRAPAVIGMSATDPGTTGMEINLPHGRNSNGFKKFFLGIDDEVSFLMSKDPQERSCAVDVIKERKGAWRQGRRGGPPKPAAKKVTLKDKIKQLVEMDADQVLQNASLFQEILDSKELESSHLYKIVTLLASKALSEDTRSDRLYRLFLESPAMQASLRTTIIKQGAGKHHGSFMEECLSLIFEIVMRSSNPKELRGLLPLQELIDAWENTVRTGSSVSRKGLSEDVVAILKFLEKHFPEDVCLDRILGAKAPKLHRSAAEDYAELLEADHYQAMPILPTSAEMIGQCAFEVQENMRTYDKCEDYIQTHFMLLREDYIEPLRAGIKLFMQGRHSPKDLHVYTGVKVVGVLSTWEGLVYRIELPKHQIRRVNWEKSKQLMYGSLLALSDDNFDSLIWATVWRRDLDLIANKAQLDVRLPFDPFDDRLAPGSEFCCIENVTIYFEAYRHVLIALQTMRPVDVPFQNTLLAPEPDPEPPGFLKAESDMFHFHNVFASCEKVDCPVAAPKSFKILQEWPEALKETLDLDPSQLEAIQHALTNQVALIQGPPGTGKTYVGLKIVQTLLENTSNLRHSPILVVCMTNHALDQFLEGIYKINGRIARIGSRSKSEAMKSRNLKELVAEIRPSTEYYQARKALTDRRDMLRTELKKALADIDRHTVSAEQVKNLLEDERWERFYEGYLDYMCGDTAHLPEDAFEVDDPIMMKILKAWLETKDPAKYAPVIKKEAGGLPSFEKFGPALGEEDDEDDDDDDQKKDDAEEEEADQMMYDRRLDDNVEFVDEKKKSHMDYFQELEHAWLPSLEEHWDRLTPEMRSFDWRNEENLWRLPLPKRRETFRQWLLEAHHEARRTLPELARLLERNAESRAALERDRKLAVLREMEVVGMTTTAVSKYQQLLKELRPEIVIVEEAAEVLEAHILAALHPRTQHVVLIGDHQQLRPSTAVYRLSKNFHLDVSLFERLIHNKASHVTLLQQRRMHPKISRLIRPLYPLLRDHASTESYPNILGVDARCYFMRHYQFEDNEGESHSKQNSFEANFISALCAYLVKSGYQESQITVLSPYLGQVRLLKQKLRRDPTTNNVDVKAVDNFQGEENDIIVVSLVRSNRQRQLGFVAVENRINVALTRARHGMFIIGNSDMLEKYTFWSQIMDELKTDMCIGDCLPLLDEETGAKYEVKCADEIAVLLGNTIHETGGEGMISLDEYKQSQQVKKKMKGKKGGKGGKGKGGSWEEEKGGGKKGDGKQRREDPYEGHIGLDEYRSSTGRSSKPTAQDVDYRPLPTTMEADGVECEMIQKKTQDDDDAIKKTSKKQKKQKQGQVLLKLSG